MQNGQPAELFGTVLQHKHEGPYAYFECDACISFLARFLAKHLGFSVADAEAHDVAWYRDEVGAEYITLKRAAHLRTMVIVECEIARVN